MITRERLYELLKTILDGRVFGFDDDLCIIKVKVPVDPNDVKGLSDFVKSMLKNTCRPFPIPDVDRHIGDGSFKIFGDFVDHDETLKVGVDGRLGVDVNALDPMHGVDRVLAFDVADNKVIVTTMEGGERVVREYDVVISECKPDKHQPKKVILPVPIPDDETTKKIIDANLKTQTEIVELRMENASLRRQLNDFKKYMDEQLATCVRAYPL